MSAFRFFLACGESVAQCLTVISPDAGDTMFGGLMALAEGRDGMPDPAPGGSWFRMAPQDGTGFAYIGPVGGDHHFQAAAPPGVDPAGMAVLPPTPRGELFAQAEALRRDAQALAAGQAVGAGGGQTPLSCTEDERPMAQAIALFLDGALALRDPGRLTAVMREAAGTFMETLPKGPKEALAAATGQVAQLRDRFAADGRLWATALMRGAVGSRLLEAGPATPLLFKLFNPAGHMSDPEHALQQAVQDFCNGGAGGLMAEACDKILAQAEAAKEAALDAQAERTHRQGLFSACSDAFTVLRTMEAVRDGVPQERWPEALKPGIVSGYISTAEEIVVRAGQALTVACINLGSHAAMRRHRALVAQLGPAKADELIEEYWFYPRAARPFLIGAGPA